MTRKDLLNQAKSLNLIRLSKLNKSELQALIEARFKGEVPLKHQHQNSILKRVLRSPCSSWVEEDLRALTSKNLEVVSMAVGIVKSGLKARKIQRLLDYVEVRKALVEFEAMNLEEDRETCQAIASAYLGRELKAFCKKAGVFIPSTKYGMAVSLLRWRKSTTARAKEFFQEAKKIRSERQAAQLAAA